MRITVVGIGAIGGVVASELDRAGAAPTLLASPRSATGFREQGLRVRDHRRPDVVHVTHPRVETDARAIGEQDVVLLCLKEPALRGAARELAPLVGPDTRIVTMLNGIPWWYMHGLASAPVFTGATAIEPYLPSASCIGCVIYLASSVADDGTITPRATGRFILGDATPGRGRERVDPIAALLAPGGWSVEVTDDIRRATWVKLLGNLALNPMTALTGAVVSRLLDDPLTLQFIARLMAEGIAVAKALGTDPGITVEERIAVLEPLRDTRTSMLQDLEAGKTLEIDAIIGAVSELGRAAAVPTPFADTLLGLIRVRAATAGLA